MARHDVRFTIPERKLGPSDIEFRVKRNGHLFGRLWISKGALFWIPSGMKSGYRVGWRKFANFAKKDGSRRRK